MNRLVVPGLGFIVVIGLSGLLIGAIVLRSPDTHGNLWEGAPEGYGRTPITIVGQRVGDIELLLDERRLPGGSPIVMDRGRFIYLSRGCATCHGLDARGGPVGPPVAGASETVVGRMVRKGRGGMPAYSENHLGETDLASLARYLSGLEIARPRPEEVAALQHLTYDPTVPVGVLLKGRSAVRRSCGACHAQPDREDLEQAFHSDNEATGLVAEMLGETSMSLEDARAIAHYILAIRHDAGPLKTP